MARGEWTESVGQWGDAPAAADGARPARRPDHRRDRSVGTAVPRRRGRRSDGDGEDDGPAAPSGEDQGRGHQPRLLMAVIGGALAIVGIAGGAGHRDGWRRRSRLTLADPLGRPSPRQHVRQARPAPLEHATTSTTTTTTEPEPQEEWTRRPPPLDRRHRPRPPDDDHRPPPTTTAGAPRRRRPHRDPPTTCPSDRRGHRRPAADDNHDRGRLCLDDARTRASDTPGR